jgi:hypothetical protein
MEQHLHQQRIERALESVYIFHLMLMQQFFLKLVQVIERKVPIMEQLQLQQLTLPILGYV